MGAYFSTDATIDTGDLLFASCGITGLAPGASVTCNGPVHIPTSLLPGVYFVGVIADYHNVVTEGNKGNNTAVTGPITVTGPSQFPSLTVAVSGSGTGTVTSNQGGINCGTGNTGSCSTTLTNGTSVTLTANPTSLDTFGGWGGDYAGQGNPCSITMSASRTVMATFNSAHTLTITGGPGGSPNPVASGGTATLSVSATDSLGHALTYLWSVLSCPGLPNTGSFNNTALQTPTWTAPANTTGSQQNCTIQVTVSDGAGGLSQQKSYQQGVSPQGVVAPEPLVPQVLNVSIGTGPGGDEQETFLTTDPITAGATYYDPNPTCVGVAPVVRQLLFFNLEGQLILTREDVSSTQLAPGSKYQVLSLSLAPGTLPAGAYNLTFLVRDCTSVNIFVSGFYPIRVLTP